MGNQDVEVGEDDVAVVVVDQGSDIVVVLELRGCCDDLIFLFHRC